MKEQYNFVDKVFLVLYLIAGFIPTMGALDVVYTQWLYISGINLLALIYVYVNKNDFNFSFNHRLSTVYFGVFIFFFLASCLSVINADIISESIVELSRWMTLIIAFFLIYLIVKKAPKQAFEGLNKIILIVFLLESLPVINFFISKYDVARSIELIQKLKHNYGNMNILAASLVMKLPFALFTLLFYSRIWKFLAGFSIFTCILSLFYLSARTAALSSSIILVLTSLYYLFKIKDEFVKNMMLKILPLLLLTLVAVFVSLNTNRIRAERMNSIKEIFFPKRIDELYVKDLKNVSYLRTSGRRTFWYSAIEDFKTSPIFGVGIGNWKIMPKDKILINYKNTNKYKYPKRVHNDFLQVLAETGIIGFIFFTMLFILVFIVFYRLFTSEADDHNKNYYIVVMLSFFAYVLDAIFNFPHERTPIQMLVFMVIALLLAFLPKQEKSSKIPFASIFLMVALTVLTLYVNRTVFKSAQVQNTMYSNFIGKNLLKAKYNVPYQKLINDLPSFPELTSIGRSKNHPLAMFAFSEGKYDLAMEHLNKAIELTPEQHEHYGLKAILFYQVDELKNIDSAFYYAKKSFAKQPSVKANYTIMKKYYADRKDTTKVMNLIDEFLTTSPKDADEWINKAKYIKYYFRDDKMALKAIDSAIELNPYDKKLINYKKERFTIKKGIDNKPKDSIAAQKRELTDEEKYIKKHYGIAMQFFKEKKHKQAKAEFHKVMAVRPNNNANLINLALVEIKLKNYNEAITHLTKVIDADFMKNGQPEYNRGLSYLRLGNKKKAAEDFTVSKQKGYKKAIQMSDKLLNK